METLNIALLDLNQQFGGGQIALRNMGCALSKLGHEVHLIFGKRDIPDRLKPQYSSNYFLHNISGYKNISNVINIKERVKNDVLTLCNKNRFDVIAANGITGMFIPFSLQDRFIVTLHGNNIKRGLNLLKFSIKNSEMRSEIPRASRNFIKNIFGHFLYGNLEKIVGEKAKFVITLTQAEATYVNKYYLISNQKIRVIPNVVSMSKELECQELHMCENKKYILSVGSMEFIKGTPILAKCMEYILSKTNDITYVSIGKGTFMYKIKELKTKFPTKVIIIPQINTGLYSIYANSEMLIQASLYEAFPLSISEAMLAKKPVIAFKLASVPEFMINGFTGCLAEKVNAFDLAKKTLDLIRNDEKAEIMGLNAKKIIETRYNYEVVGKRMESVLKEV